MNYSLSFSLNSSMQSIFCPSKQGFLRQTMTVMVGVLVLAFASQLSIPLQPVPLTIQSATVVLIGMAYGPRYGSYVVITYLLAGICGIPVFADFSAGLPKFFGPSMGYLIGFLPAALLSGYLAKKGFAKNIYTSFIAACLGSGIIFLFGVTTLAQFIGLHSAITFGVMPFIVSEPIKLAAVACIIPSLWKKQ